MACKITFIGAGSLLFTRTLLTDIMSVPLFGTWDIAFTDISQENLDRVLALCEKDLKANGIKKSIFATTNRREALKDAKYVINCVRVGGVEAFTSDIEIPLKYGVDQCVGDTLCVGGIMYGQRGIAAVLDFCQDIREVSHPEVLLLNYSNPNAMITMACNHYGKVNTIGLCHGEIHGEMQIGEILGVPRQELDVICAGINHQTWYLSVKHKGKDMRHKLVEGFEKHPEFSKQEKVRIDILKRFGYYSTESNGHLSEYLAWYRKTPEELERWVNMDKWIHGETGGYLRDTRESRERFDQEFQALLEGAAKKYSGEDRGFEHGSYILEALETGQIYRGHMNVINQQCITNLPEDAIVEVPCYVDGNGVSVPRIGDLPLGCAAICSQSIWVQKLAVEAAVKGDKMILKQAAMMDPLTGAVCNTEQISQMIEEMILAQKQWLPQY